ncbi:MAG: hypothetical protein QOE88_2500, partial [Verrucomicrobiota bacterium]|nr:hypothetical protein [Verrucomicrobiota bacterium]
MGLTADVKVLSKKRPWKVWSSPA